MTTPEAFKRRQLIEGALLGVLGLFVIGQAVVSDQRDEATLECLTHIIDASNEATSARAELIEQDSENTREAITGVATSRNPQQVTRVLAKYVREQTKIQKEREKHPAPQTPTSRCD
jgi:hypothetical protein